MLQKDGLVGRILQYAVAPGTVICATLMSNALNPWLQDAVFTLFWVAVIGTSVVGGFGPCVVAALLSVLAVDYYFVSPGVLHWSLEENLQSIIFFLSACSMGLVAASLRHTRHKHREAEQRFHDLTENLSEAFWVKDAFSGRIIFMSPAYETIWQRPRTALYEDFEHFLDTIHPDDRDRVVRALPQQLGTGYSEEYRIVRPDGSVRWVHARAFPVRDREGNVYRIAGFTQDITHRREAEEALRASEARLRLMLGQLPVAIWTTDRDLHVTSALGDATALRWDPRSAVGKHVREAARDEQATAAHESALAGTPGHFERQVLETGVVYDVHVEPLRDGAGRIVGTVGIGVSVTERLQMEAALRAREEEMRLITDSLPALVAYVDVDGYYRFVNRMYEEWYEAPRESICGRHVRDLLGEAVYEGVKPRIDAVLRGERVAFETFLPQVGDGRYTHTTYVPRTDAEGQVVGFFVLVLDITERVRIEKALRESEREFRAIFELAGSGKTQADPITGLFTRANRKYCEMTGYSEEELLRMPFIQLTHPDDREVELLKLARVISGERNGWTSEKRYVRKDGTVVWVHVTGTVMRDAEGQPNRIIATIQDVTDRVRYEEALRESAEEFRHLANAMPQIVWMSDATGSTTFLNQRWAAYTGLSPEDARGAEWSSVLHPEDQACVEKDWVNSLTAGTPFEGEYRLRRGSDGAYRWHLGRATPVRDASGNVMKWIGTSTDVHDLKQAEEALRQSEARFRVALRNARTGVYTTDRELRYTWAYDVATTLREDIVGKRAEDVVPPELAQRLTRIKERVLSTGKGVREIVEVLLDGHYSVRDLTVEPWRDRQGNIVGLIGAGTDITDLKRAEKELRELNDRLEQRVAERTEQLLQSQEALRQSERLAAIGQMMAGLSHESRNALQRSYACLQMLERRFPENPAALGLVREALAAHEDLRQVFEEVQGYAAPMVLDRQVTDIGEVYRRAWRSLASLQLDRNVAFEDTSETTDLSCDIDSFRMEQVFRNLMENSLAASEDPLKVAVTCREEHINGCTALRVSVRDTGPGLDPELAARIFEPFYTTKTKGTGLGMAIVKRIVEAHGGTVSVEPNPGQGLEVSLILPRRAAP